MAVRLGLVAVLIPTLGRAHKVAGIVENLRTTAPAAVPYFIVESHDKDTINAVAVVDGNLIVNDRVSTYAGAINCGLLNTYECLLYVSADDFVYRENWLDPLINLSRSYGVVGSNDLHNQDVKDGVMATSFLIRRDYAYTACVDAPGLMLHEGYTHNYVDTEVIGYARSRGEFISCASSEVEHMHPLWGLAPSDDTYAKGLKDHAADGALFQRRRTMWAG